MAITIPKIPSDCISMENESDSNKTEASNTAINESSMENKADSTNDEKQIGHKESMRDDDLDIDEMFDNF